MATGKIVVAEGSDKNIAAHSFTEDSETRYVERVAPGAGILTLPGTAQAAEKTSTGVFPASPIDIIGKAGVTVKANFSAGDISCKIKMQFFDSAGALMVQSDEYSIGNTQVADGSRYLGSALVVDNGLLGASGLKISITAAPASGNVSFFVAGV